MICSPVAEEFDSGGACQRVSDNLFYFTAFEMKCVVPRLEALTPGCDYNARVSQTTLKIMNIFITIMRKG